MQAVINLWLLSSIHCCNLLRNSSFSLARQWCQSTCNKFNSSTLFTTFQESVKNSFFSKLWSRNFPLNFHVNSRKFRHNRDPDKTSIWVNWQTNIEAWSMNEKNLIEIFLFAASEALPKRFSSFVLVCALSVLCSCDFFFRKAFLCFGHKV